MAGPNRASESFRHLLASIFFEFSLSINRKTCTGGNGDDSTDAGGFAADYSQQLIDCYINEYFGVGDALLKVRRMVLHRRNPLGLFYVLQCPCHVAVGV